MIDLNLSTIQDQRIVLSELYHNTPRIIEAKTFRGCTFIGPGNVCFAGLFNVQNSHFKDCDVVCLKKPVQICTAIGLRHVHIDQCEFRSVLLMVDVSSAQSMPKDRFITEVPKIARSGASGPTKQ
jgi:hypothetical protein